MKRCALVFPIVFAACLSVQAPPIVQPPVWPDASTVATMQAECRALWEDELERPIDDLALSDCVGQRIDAGRTIEDFRAQLRASAEYAALQASKRRLFPEESGRLRIEGARFIDEAGRVWQWRGATMFLLFEHVLRGRDITPQIRWMQRHGVNVARVFVAGVSWLPPWCPVCDAQTARPDLRPDYAEQLGAFFDRLAAEGLRVEATVITEDRPAPDWRRAIQTVYDVAASRWNVFVEAHNEPWVRDVDTLGIMAGVNRRGVLSSYGFHPQWDNGFVPDSPRLDYWTIHSDRNLEYAARNSKDLQEVQAFYRQPAVGDEPIGFADFNRSGGGTRTTNAEIARGYFSICALLAAGCTFHFDAGVYGFAPGPHEPITEAIATEVSKIWQFIPPESQLGAYTRPGLGGWPLANGNSESRVDHAYASHLGARAFVVMTLARPDFVPAPVDGFRVDQVSEVAPWIFSLIR